MFVRTRRWRDGIVTLLPSLQLKTTKIKPEEKRENAEWQKEVSPRRAATPEKQLHLTWLVSFIAKMTGEVGKVKEVPPPTSSNQSGTMVLLLQLQTVSTKLQLVQESDAQRCSDQEINQPPSISLFSFISLLASLATPGKKIFSFHLSLSLHIFFYPELFLFLAHLSFDVVNSRCHP